MLKLLNEAYRIEHLRGEHLPKLSVLDRLVIMLSYYCDYRTMENIVFEYGVAKSTICECVKWVENILIKSEEFFLPQKKGTCQGHWDRSRAGWCYGMWNWAPKKIAEILFRKKEKTYDKGSDSGRLKEFKDTQRLVFARERPWLQAVL